MNDISTQSKTTYRRLVAYTFNYWKIFLLAVAGMILVALSQPGFAALMEPMLDGSFVNKDFTVLLGAISHLFDNFVKDCTI